MTSPLIRIGRQLLLAASAALLASAATAQTPNASFDLIGHIEAFTLAAPGDPLTRATMTIKGIPVIVPSNLLIVMPGQYLTAHDLFRWDATGHAFAATARPQSGLALRDAPPPAVPFEAEAVGNIVPGVGYVAGVMRVSQGALHVVAGPILSLDAATGEMRVGFAPTGVRVRLNDPQGLYGAASTTLDQRFALDPDNIPVHAKTGFPVCVPRNDAPGRCPASNRPPAGAAHNRFTCAGTGTLGVPAAADAPSVNCNPSLPVPLAVGDYVTVAGMLTKDAAGDFLVAAHGLVAELGIYTSPGRDPAYLFIEEALQGAKGEPYTGFDQEETTRFRVVGFTTDPTRNVEVVLYDSGFPASDAAARTSISGTAGIAPSNGPQLGRFRNTWPAKSDARAVRRDVRATIVGAPVASGPLSKLRSGLYEAPMATYLYPENTTFGIGPFTLPVSFENFCFLRKPGAQIATLETRVRGPLSPFPEPLSGPGSPRRSQAAGTSGVRVCGD